MASTYPQFILLGDSITQSSISTLQSYLQTAYIRRLDIINRGFSGYTAPRGLRMLNSLLPQDTPASSSHQPHIKLLTVFFGANDSIAAEHDGLDLQYVALPDFQAALRGIVQYPVLQAQGTKVILMTPPPANEYQLASLDFHRGRTAANTANYAQAVRDVGIELGVPVVDVWSSFMRKAGWEQGHSGPLPGSQKVGKTGVLESLLSDGLHLTDEGYKLVYAELMAVIEKDLPELSPDKLPLVLSMNSPGWEWERIAAYEQLTQGNYPSGPYDQERLERTRQEFEEVVQRR